MGTDIQLQLVIQLYTSLHDCMVDTLSISIAI